MSQFSRYSGMGVKMGLTITIFILLGKYIDQKVQLEKPWFTIILSLLGVFAAIYGVLKDFLKKDK